MIKLGWLTPKEQNKQGRCLGCLITKGILYRAPGELLTCATSLGLLPTGESTASLAGIDPTEVSMLIADLIAPLAVRLEPLLTYGVSIDIGLVDALETCPEPPPIEPLATPGVCGRWLCTY